MKLEKIKEGSVEFQAPKYGKVPSREMSVFYNPVMSFQRDLNVVLLKSLNKKDLLMADILAGSGVRSLRFLKEFNGVKSILVNDINPKAHSLIKKNIKDKRAIITNKNANDVLNDFSAFDYIDIDPFGSPNYFLDLSIQKLARNGILAVTATDTAPLSGTYPSACLRKYWSVPLRNELMHELGLRILIRKIQLIGAQYDKALTPIFSHSTEHYMRVYFECKKGKKLVDDILKSHKFFHYCNVCLNRFVSDKNEEFCCNKKTSTAGHLWTKNLWNSDLVNKMIKQGDHKNFLETILEESKIPVVGFYDTHKFGKKLKIVVPKIDSLIDSLKSKGFSASRSHFNPVGIRSNCKVKDFLKAMKNNKKFIN